VWKTKSTLRRKESIEVVSLDGKKEEINLEPNKVVTTDKDLGDLVKQTSSSGKVFTAPHPPSSFLKVLDTLVSPGVVPEVPTMCTSFPL
jgi:hypothetical protein